MSVARPASTTSAPARSACSMGSWPIMATMCVHLDSVAASKRLAGRQRVDASALELRRSRSRACCSLKISRHGRSSPSSAQIAPAIVGDPVHAGVRPAGAAGADDQRYPGAARGREEQAQVAAHGALGRLGHAGAEVVGPGVGRAAVDGDDVGAQTQAAGDGLGG